MAYLLDPNKDEDELKAGQAPQQQGQGGLISGGGASAATPMGEPKSTKSGNWTNLTRYLDANKGQGGVMGQAVAGTVGKTADAYNASNTAYTGAANTRIKDSTVRDTGVVGQLDAMFKPPTATPSAPPPPPPPGPTPVAPGMTANVTQGPTPAAPLTKEALDRQTGATWKGPNAASEVEGYADTEKGAQKLSTYGKFAGDYQDSGMLLRDTYGAGSQYGRGERQLDTFLLGGDAAGKAALDDISTKYSGTQDGWKANLKGINDRIVSGRDTTNQTATTTSAAVAGARDRGGKIIAGGQKTAEELGAADAAIFEAIKSGDLKTLATFGLDADDVAWAKNNKVDLATLASGAPTAYGLGDVLDDGDQASWTQLMAALGSKNEYDFTETGAKAVSVDGGKAQALNDATALEKAARDRLKDDKSGEQVSIIMSLAGSIKDEDRARAASMIGMTREELDYYAGKGGDIRKLITNGPAKGVADFMSDKATTRYADLLKLLGGTSNLGPKVTGSPYSFDQTGFRKELQGYRDADRVAGEQAAAASSAAEGQSRQQGYLNAGWTQHEGYWYDPDGNPFVNPDGSPAQP